MDSCSDIINKRMLNKARLRSQSNKRKQSKFGITESGNVASIIGKASDRLAATGLLRKRQLPSKGKKLPVKQYCPLDKYDGALAMRLE